MEDKGQLTGVPIKLVMALVIGAMVMGIMTQIVGTAERTAMRDMHVSLDRASKGYLKVRVEDAQSGEPLDGATIIVRYPGGTKADTISGRSDGSHTFRIPMGGKSYVLVSVRVTCPGYIPWEGEVVVSK